MQSHDELCALLFLHRRLEANPRPLNRLLTAFGTAIAARAQRDAGVIAQAGLAPRQVEMVCAPGRANEERRIDDDLRWLEQSGHQLLQPGDAKYPTQLGEIHDPPCLLFVDGDASLLSNTQLAIVGSRRPTAAGRRLSHQFASDACEAGLTVTSGLALGIDGRAHEGALAANGKTIAVMGTGCDINYPPSNRRLADRIRADGVVVSEFPLGANASRWSFPQRNRIVTGLSLGTLVVEAALRSGSLISARLAMEQGREVFAVPGSPFNAQSCGCHQLIRDGAKLTENINDVLEELPGFETDRNTRLERALVQLPSAQQKMIGFLGVDPVSIDQLSALCDASAADVLSLMIQLEIEGVVASEPAGYVLAGRWRERS